MLAFFQFDLTIRRNKMTQLHRRFTDEQVRVLLRGYCQGLLTRADIQEMVIVRTLVQDAGRRADPHAVPACLSYANRRDRSAPPRSR